MPFEPGQSGNPEGGRLRKRLTQEALMLELKQREKSADAKGMRLIVTKVIDLAEGGERWAAEFIRDTIDGKPIQAVEGGLTLSADETIAGLMQRVAANGARLIPSPEE